MNAKPVCTRCGQPLARRGVVWLELDQRTGRYLRPGLVEPEHSQGAFPFGRDCARALTFQHLPRLDPGQT